MTNPRILIYGPTGQEVTKALTLHNAFNRAGWPANHIPYEAGKLSTDQFKKVLKESKATHLFLFGSTFTDMLVGRTPAPYSLEDPQFSLPIWVYLDTWISPYLLYLNFYRHFSIQFLSPFPEQIQFLKTHHFDAHLVPPFFEDLFFEPPKAPLNPAFNIGYCGDFTGIELMKLRNRWSLSMHNTANDLLIKSKKALPQGLPIAETLSSHLPTDDLDRLDSLEASLVMYYLVFSQFEIRKEWIMQICKMTSHQILGVVNNTRLEFLNRQSIGSSTDTKQLYQQAAVGLGIPKHTQDVDLNAFNIAACAGVCFHPDTPDARTYFKPDQTIVLYQSIEELRDKMLFYLKHPEKRIQMGQAAYTHVRQHFSPQAFIRSLISCVEYA